MNENITLEANGEFPFKFYIEKALPVDEDGELIIEGIASTTNVDHDNERMSADALRDMANVINEKSVPLRVEHSKDDTAIIGKVYKAWVDDRNQLHIRASLDKSHMIAPLLHNSMKQGVKMGLSVGGIVKRATKEFVESVGKMVKTFYDVVLNEVSVTPRPANYDSWLVAKHIVEKEEDGDGFRDSALHNEFLFQNPQLDYLQVFAKSIPDKAWQKVDMPDINKNNKNKDMSKKDEKMAEDETTKSVTRGEFDALKSAITKGFESVGKALGKMMGDDAMDQHQPNKKKPEDESPTAKAEDGARDEDQPAKKKPEPEKETAKAEDDETETKEKAESETEEEDEKKKSETESDYKLETVERSIRTIDALTKKIKKTETETETKEKAETETETKTKSEDDKEDEETETKEKTTHPIDQFVMAVTKALEAMNDKMEKSGKTVLGFDKSIVESIKNDPKIQEEITKMMKVPGQKKSVAMGVPYMVTKDGKRYSLTATETGSTVEKSRDDNKGKSFKDVYKSEYSSVKSEE